MNSSFNFQTQVIEQSFQIPVVVDFWAPWCGPCKLLTPILEKLAAENLQNWTLIKINTDDFPSLSQQYAIRSIPNVKLFFKGKVTAEFMGAMPEKSIADWLQKHLPNKFFEEFEKIKRLSEAIQKNQLTQEVQSTPEDQLFQEDQLIQELENYLGKDAKHSEALLMLASLLVFRDSQRAENLLKDLPFSTEYKEQADAVFFLAHLFKREDLPFHDEYLQCIRHLQEKRFDKAVEGLINIIKSDRNLDRDGARKICIAVFKFLGDNHPVSVKFRRSFSSALFI